MLRTEHEPSLEARSVQSGSPITLIQGAEMIVIDPEVLRDILDQHWPPEDREPDHGPCEAEIHSWTYFTPEQADSYWIRCGLLGPHTEHEDSNTGAHWTD